jgi:hypothetical protein
MLQPFPATLTLPDFPPAKSRTSLPSDWRNPLMHVYIHPDASSETPVAAPQHLRVFFDDDFLDSFARCYKGASSDTSGFGATRGQEGPGDEGGESCVGEKSWEQVLAAAVQRGHEVVWSKKGLIHRYGAPHALERPASCGKRTAPTCAPSCKISRPLARQCGPETRAAVAAGVRIRACSIRGRSPQN